MRKKREVRLEQEITKRPWGEFQTLRLEDGFRVKKITVIPGGKLSLQKHAHRAEHWVVVQGTAWVTVDQTQKEIQTNEHIFIPLGAVHRLENRGSEALFLIEVQLGSYLGEDDIVRLEDTYGRT
jgi:mannose-6-phosphate isomerase-like protein (cupin superfamily)